MTKVRIVPFLCTLSTFWMLAPPREARRHERVWLAGQPGHTQSVASHPVQREVVEHAEGGVAEAIRSSEVVEAAQQRPVELR